MKSIPLLLAPLLLTAATLAADPPQTGSLQLTFTDRSPLSSLATLAHRFHIIPKPPATALEDYDLSKETFLAYVPASYDPAQHKPLGLIVLANYKHSDELPTPILPELDAANVAFITPKEYLGHWYQRAGLAIDAAYNMQKRYNIDPKRIYLFGGGDWPDVNNVENNMTAPHLFLNFPEVFTGTFTVSIYSYRPVRADNGGLYAVDIPHPDAPQFNLAKQRPIVFGSEDTDAGHALIFASYKADGFRFTKTIPMTIVQFHYPNYQPGWIPEVLQFLDASAQQFQAPTTEPNPNPTPTPTSQPTTLPKDTHTHELKFIR